MESPRVKIDCIVSTFRPYNGDPGGPPDNILSRLLKQSGSAYYDTGGSLYLKLPEDGLLIDIERPPPKLQERHANSIFTGAREQVVHTLLQRRDQWCTGVDIASASQTSPYTVSRAGQCGGV